MRLFILSCLLFLFSLVLGSEGDICRASGLVGTCKKVAKCTLGFTANNACPNDPSDVKCCLDKECQNPDTKAPGDCLDSDRLSCANGKTYITGQCPGSSTVLCCAGAKVPNPQPGPPVTTPTATPPKPAAPKAPTCPKVKVSVSWGVSNYIFARDVTKQLTTPTGIAAALAGVCGGLTAASAGALAPLCAIIGAELAVLSLKSDECADKSQCMKLKFLPFSSIPIPFCVGKKDGCCGGNGEKSSGVKID